MHRYQILIEYVGTNFIGWQIQSKGQSVQKLIQIKISKLLKEKINLVGSGRTDSGVHAIGQSAHFDCKKKIENLDKFLKSINYFLNIKLVSITSIKKKSLNFHARFSAKQRIYTYIIFNRISGPSIEKNRGWHIKKKLDLKFCLRKSWRENWIFSQRCRVIFSFAISMEDSEISVANILSAKFSISAVIAIQPVPVPISSSEPTFPLVFIRSIRISVSGRGMSTF